MLVTRDGISVASDQLHHGWRARTLAGRRPCVAESQQSNNSLWRGLCGEPAVQGDRGGSQKFRATEGPRSDLLVVTPGENRPVRTP